MTSACNSFELASASMALTRLMTHNILLMVLQVSHPFEHKSDSFYFVDDKLIMHNKAAYEYVEEQ